MRCTRCDVELKKREKPPWTANQEVKHLFDYHQCPKCRANYSSVKTSDNHQQPNRAQGGSMQTHFMARVEAKSVPSKALTLKAIHLKTQTKLELRFTKDDRATMDVFNDVTNDIRLLKLQAAPVSLEMAVQKAQAIGDLVNRSVIALSKVGVEIGEVEWGADSISTGVEGALTLTGSDLPILMEVLSRLVMRSLAATSGTRHPLTLYDFKQATGIAYDAKQGDEDAQAIMDWFDVRELVVLEETKEAKAEEKAKAMSTLQKAKAARIKEKVKAKVAPKAKSAAKATEKNASKAPAKTANLGNLS